MNRIIYLLVIALFVASAASARAIDLTWARQPGSPGWDTYYAASADGLGNVYATGETQISKYSTAGDLLWIRSTSTGVYQRSWDVSADGLGSLYICGEQDGSEPNGDAFVTRLDASGNTLWTQTLSTTKYDIAHGVSADKLGNVYLAGTTSSNLAAPAAGSYDAFVSKISGTGAVLWTRQFGTSGYDETEGVSADGLGNVYACGWTAGSLDGPTAGQDDAFIRKYSDDSTPLWARQFGTPRIENAFAIAADQLGNVFTAGDTNGTLGETWLGSSDVFLRKYDADGNLQWTRQFGTSRYDECFNISADGLGNVYVAGSLNGIDDGQDAFVRKYDSAGNLLWDTQFGTPVYDSGRGVSADGLGNVYVTGLTGGSLGGPNAGDYDAFVVKFTDPVPEPASLVLIASAAALLCSHRSRNKPHR